MANQRFDASGPGFLTGALDYDTATFKISLIRGYTFNAAHVFLSEVTAAGGTLVSTVTLAGKTVSSAGAALATNPVWASVASGAAIPAAILYQSSAPTGGADLATSAQRLVAFYNDPSNGFPITPNGQAITGVIVAGVNGLFRL